MKKLQQRWRHGPSYAERQKSTAGKYRFHIPHPLLPDSASGDAVSSSIQVLKVPERPLHNIRLTRTRSDRCGEPEIRIPIRTIIPPTDPPRPNPNTHFRQDKGKGTNPRCIPYDDIRSQIRCRADAECPKPPPNTPPPGSPRKSMAYCCGDFTYDIPLDDPFARKLFQPEPTQVIGHHLEGDEGWESEAQFKEFHDPDEGDEDESKGQWTAHLHSQSSISLPLPPKRNEAGSPRKDLTHAANSSDASGRSEPEHDRSTHTKPPPGNKLQSSQSTNTVDSRRMGSFSRKPIPGTIPKWTRNSPRVIAQNRSTRIEVSQGPARK